MTPCFGQTHNGSQIHRHSSQILINRLIHILSNLHYLFFLSSFTLSLSLQFLDHLLHRVDNPLSIGIKELIFLSIGIRNDVIVHRAIRIDEIDTREVRTI
mgnify:CR=1 FL=1